MNATPEWMFYHAIIAGMLASNDPKLHTYKGYIQECMNLGIAFYGELLYNEFMQDCDRTTHLNVFKEDTSAPSIFGERHETPKGSIFGSDVVDGH